MSRASADLLQPAARAWPTAHFSFNVYRPKDECLSSKMKSKSLSRPGDSSVKAEKDQMERKFYVLTLKVSKHERNTWKRE